MNGGSRKSGRGLPRSDVAPSDVRLAKVVAISADVHGGHGSLGNNYLGQRTPSALIDFLF